MKTIKFFNCLIITAFIFMAPIRSAAQNCGPINTSQLKEMLTQLGYTVKDLNSTQGKEKYEASVKTPNFDVPIAFEISSSTNFVWLTAFLGSAKEETSITNNALLKQNAKIQPCQFYISESGKLMMGMAVENRGLTNAILRRHIDKLANDVSSTASYWQ